jgi:hypothetical protein
VNKTQILALAIGLLTGVGYITLHLWDRRRRACAAKPGQIALPVSPVAMGVRLALMVAVIWAVIRFLPEGKFWFAGAFVAVYTMYFVWDLTTQLLKKNK